jgi:hypothetical protein
MPKFPTSPYLFDEEKHLSITKLIEWDYLKEQTLKSSTITWSRNGIKTSSIGIHVKIDDYESYITVNYKCNETDYNYKIRLESIPSNLGKGKLWYFICPFTHQRCRKLHLISEKFIHRSALPGGMYSTQTESKKWREMSRLYGSYFKLDKLYEQLYSKHFRTHYKGKQTKKYIKLMNLISKAERIPIEEIERLMAS